MGIASVIASAVSGLAKPITGMMNKRTQRKINQDSIKGKLALQTQGDATSITLTDAEWETVGQSLQHGTWKDEYITLSVGSIINLIVVGGVASAFGHPEILEGVTVAIRELNVAMDGEVGTLILAVAFAAIGLKVWRA